MLTSLQNYLPLTVAAIAAPVVTLNPRGQVADARGQVAGKHWTPRNLSPDPHNPRQPAAQFAPYPLNVKMDGSPALDNFGSLAKWSWG
jgi:hypothetical protein